MRQLVARRLSPSDVDDVVQDVLLAVGAEGSAPRTGAYVAGIARKKVADHHRKRAREHARLARLALERDEPEEDDGEPTTEAEARLTSVLAQFLEQVSPPHRDAVRAVDLEGRPQIEVARQLGIPPSSLRTRVQRGRAELRAALRECCEIETDGRGRVMSCEPRGASRCTCE